MKPVDLFIQDFMREAASHREVTNFLLFGSAANGTWHPGSDIDMVICLSDSAPQVRAALVQKFWELDEKHGTGIINAPALHPPIFFLWGWRKWLFRFFVKHGCLLKVFKILPTGRLKGIAPRHRHIEGLKVFFLPPHVRPAQKI